MLDMFYASRKKKVARGMPKPPSVMIPDKTMEHGFNALNEALLANLMPSIGGFSDIWARPAPKFPAAYLWDSCFIAMAWKFWDPRVALSILKPFVQFQADDGRMPHMVFLGKIVSPLSNPPFVEMALDQISNYHEDDVIRNYFLPATSRFLAWRKKNRYNETHGLYYWIDSYESGIDNTPRFRSVDEKQDYGVNNLGAIDINAEVLIEHESILNIMSRYGITEGVDSIKEEIDRLSRAIGEKLWDSTLELFGDLDLTTGQIRTVDTIASYFPLLDISLNQEKVEKLVARLADANKYSTLVPFPTVARDAPEFMRDTWRGPVWINTAYLALQGLKRHGKSEIASELAYRLCKGVFETWHNEGSFYEFYDPNRHDLQRLSRKKGNLYKQITLGGKPVKNFAGWTALANTILLEIILGVNCVHGEWMLEPNLSEAWLASENNITINLPYYRVHIEMHLVNGTIDYDATVQDTQVTGSVQNHGKTSIGRG